jgi:homoserine trans-succinylase
VSTGNGDKKLITCVQCINPYAGVMYPYNPRLFVERLSQLLIQLVLMGLEMMKTEEMKVMKEMKAMKAMKAMKVMKVMKVMKEMMNPEIKILRKKLKNPCLTQLSQIVVFHHRATNTSCQLCFWFISSSFEIRNDIWL